MSQQATCLLSTTNLCLTCELAFTFADTEVIGDVDAPEILIGLEDTLFPSQERSMIEEWQPNTRD